MTAVIYIQNHTVRIDDVDHNQIRLWFRQGYILHKNSYLSMRVVSEIKVYA